MSLYSGAVATSGDDGHETTAGSCSSTSLQSNSIDSTNEWLGLRFQNVGTTIASGSTINSASITVTPTSITNDEPDLTIYCEDVDSAAAFSSTNNNISNRTRTTATAAWASTDLGATGSSQHTSSDLSSPVQEVVSRAGFGAGSDLAVLITSRAGDTARDFAIFMYDNATDYAEIDIDYTAPSSTGAGPIFGGRAIGTGRIMGSAFA